MDAMPALIKSLRTSSKRKQGVKALQKVNPVEEEANVAAAAPP